MNMTKKTISAKADTAQSSAQEVKPPKSGLWMSRVVHDFEPFSVGGAKTFGQMIDESIAEALATHGQVQSVEIIITDSDWIELQYEYDQNHR